MAAQSKWGLMLPPRIFRVQETPEMLREVSDANTLEMLISVPWIPWNFLDPLAAVESRSKPKLVMTVT